MAFLFSFLLNIFLYIFLLWKSLQTFLKHVQCCFVLFCSNLLYKECFGSKELLLIGGKILECGSSHFISKMQ